MLSNGSDNATEKRRECDIAPENGNCSNATPELLTCPRTINLLLLVGLVLATFTSLAIADISATTCPSDRDAVPKQGVEIGGTDEYVVCCPATHKDFVDIDPNVPYINCRNTQDKDFGMHAVSATGCSQQRNMVNNNGRGVLVCKADQREATSTQTAYAHPSLVTAVPSNRASGIHRSGKNFTLRSAVLILLTSITNAVRAQGMSKNHIDMDHQARDTDATTCPANAKAVSTIAMRNSKKGTYVVCCPSDTADLAVIDFAAKTVRCCYGPLCAYPSVDVRRCDGGIDDMMSVGYEIGGRSICLISNSVGRSLVERHNTGIAAYSVCPAGSRSTTAHYPDEERRYFACCPDDYSDKAVITNRGTDHVYCCDSHDCDASAVNALCTGGASPVDIAGDRVTICRVDEVNKVAEVFRRGPLEFEKRKGASQTSAAARGRSLPSPFFLLVTLFLTLTFVVESVLAGSTQCPAGVEFHHASLTGTQHRYTICYPGDIKQRATINPKIGYVQRCTDSGCNGRAVSAESCGKAEPTDIFGDGVEICYVAEDRLAWDIGKRKGGGRGGAGGGGCLECSAAPLSHHPPSPLLLFAPALLVLITSLTMAVAASNDTDAGAQAGEDYQNSELDICLQGSHPARDSVADAGTEGCFLEL